MRYETKTQVNLNTQISILKSVIKHKKETQKMKPISGTNQKVIRDCKKSGIGESQIVNPTSEIDPVL